MKKGIYNILLIMVVILTMTACVNSDTNSVETTVTQPSVELVVTSKTTVEFVAPITTEPAVEDIKTDFEYESFPELKVEYLTHEQTEQMGPEELSTFYSDMINLSNVESLSVDEMIIIARNFNNIWNKNSNYDVEEFSQQYYNVFCSIYNQANEHRIPLENLSSWVSIPVVDVLCKYFISSNFEFPENAYCEILYLLSEDEATRVAKVFFDNPIMATNTSIPCDFILLDFNKSISNMAWMHLEELSKSVSPKTNLPHDEFTYQLCQSLIYTGFDSRNLTKVADIAENILENPFYDIKIKYMIFCNISYDYVNKKYTDDTISSVAIDSLFNLVKNADDTMLNQLNVLVDFLNQDLSDKLSFALEERYATE